MTDKTLRRILWIQDYARKTGMQPRYEDIPNELRDDEVVPAHSYSPLKQEEEY